MKAQELLSLERLVMVDLISRWNIMIGYNETVIRIYYVINQLFEAGLMVLDKQTTYPMLMSTITIYIDGKI